MIKYDKAVANVLPQLQQFFILPRHVWEPVVGTNGKGLKNYDPAAHLPIVGAGSFFVTKYDKKGTTILTRNPGFYGKKPQLDAVGITWFANADAMLAALKGGDIDYVDEVPFTVADQLGKSGDIQLVTGQGTEIRDFGFNSNPKKKKNRELLDPKLRAALSHAFDRKQIVDVVFRGHAAPRAHAADADLGAVHEHQAARPRSTTSRSPTRCSTSSATSGARTASACTPGANSHPMAYDVITPDSLSGIDREFAIVRDSFAKIGVKLTQRSYDSTTAFAEITKPKNQYLDFDMMMWDWIGYTDPDFVLSVVGCDQYGGWSDTAYCNKEYDKLYKQQGTTLDPAKRKADRLEDAGDPLSRQAVRPARAGRADLRLPQGLDGHRAALPERSRQDPLDRSGQELAARALPHAQLRLRRQADRVRVRDDLRRDHAQLRDLPRRPRRRDDGAALPLVHRRGARAGAHGARARQVQVGAVRHLPQEPRPR